MDVYERSFTLDQFVAQEHLLIDEFKNHWDQTHEDGSDRLSIDAWVEHYNEFLAAVDSGEIKIKAGEA